MITYKLAKQLKDAGFPQKGTQGYYNNEADKICFTTDNSTTDTAGVIIEYSDPEHKIISKTSKAYIVIVPTLSELIEACGEDFGALKRYTNAWQARDFEADCPERGNIGIIKTGDTPEEAVARLWLELNSKK